jgi:hypothetical protein
MVGEMVEESAMVDTSPTMTFYGGKRTAEVRYFFWSHPNPFSQLLVGVSVKILIIIISRQGDDHKSGQQISQKSVIPSVNEGAEVKEERNPTTNTTRGTKSQQVSNAG